MDVARNATIVTGAGRGIGRATALRMSAEGPVILVGREETALAAVMKAIAAKGGLSDAVIGDVREPDTARRAVAIAQARGWRVRNLVANAGIGKSGPTHSFDPALWRDTFATNVDGAFHFVQAVLPSMREAKEGAIVLMASIAGTKGYPHIAAYVASKHALVGFARALAKEYGKEGIIAVPLCPGYVDTDMTARTIHGVMERRGVSEEAARDKVARVNPQRRIIPPEEVAEAVTFICSGKANALSGEPFMFAGGE